MHANVIQRLSERMDTYPDLVAGLPEGALTAGLPVPSNSIGAQLWCVVGARESYARALEAGAWAGFTCSLTAEGASRSEDTLAALRSSADGVRQVLAALEWTEARERLVLDLLEHEAQHQGQLIRFVYGLGLEFPDSWKQRWALS